MNMQKKADEILVDCRELVESEWARREPMMREPVVCLTETTGRSGSSHVTLSIEEQVDVVERLIGASASAAEALLREGQTPFLMAVLIAMPEGLTIRHIPCP